MDRFYNLRGVEQVHVEENVDAWIVRGEASDGFAREIVDFYKSRYEHPLDEAKEMAVEWCWKQCYATYKVSTFTPTPYVFHIATIDVVSGKVIEEHDEDYSK